MTLLLQLDQDAELRLRRLAKQAGKDLDSFVLELVDRAASAMPLENVSSPDDFDRALDELFAADSRRLPAVPLTYSRDDIYIDHD